EARRDATVPSNALVEWRGGRAAALDEIEAAHAHIGGTDRGRRYATQQVNRAYVVLLSAEFQGFCRDLHSECADLFVSPVADPDLRAMLRDNLLFGRKIDRG